MTMAVSIAIIVLSAPSMIRKSMLIVITFATLAAQIHFEPRQMLNLAEFIPNFLVSSFSNQPTTT